ncbi:MAG: Choriogenin H [Parcubacteria group bacterium GW2011_GWF2_39_13b]|nr:MAG: Choriogenin H [Parcubacteria group bacterium GW2011_GWF2_39_13b]
MLNFSQLTQDQFSRPETLQAVKAEAFDLVDHLMVPESKKLAAQLEDRLKTMPTMAASAPEIYSQYQKMVIYLRLVALMALDNNTVLELIQKNYLDSFDAGLDLNERMTGKMYSIPDLIWPEYAEQLAYALKQNIQKIGQKPIIIKGETSPQAPTIQNWLADYDRTLGPDLKNDLEQEEYLAKNPNAKLLDGNEKIKLRNVLKFYNNLKPIPTAIIEKAFRDIGVYDALEKEPGESAPAKQPYIIAEPTIIQAPKRYSRPDNRDQYLESPEEEPKTKPAPYIPPAQKPSAPVQPAYTRPVASIPPSSPLKQEAQIPVPPKPTPPSVQQPASPRPAFSPAQQPTPQIPQPQPHSQPAKKAAPQFFSQPAPNLPKIPQYEPPHAPQQDPPRQAPVPQSPYLEPINVPDLPKTSSPAKPEPDPRIQGNIVDLKNIEK